MSRHSYLLIFLFYFGKLTAQQTYPCDSVNSMINHFQHRIENINYSDPELITLHYLFVIDLENEINDFYKNRVFKFDECDGADFYKTINLTDECRDRILFLKDTLAVLKEHVDQMFYDDANLEMQLTNNKKALYFIDRSLEFKPLHVNALLLKLDILFQMKDYSSCLEVLDVLYHQVELNRDQEIRTMDFNMKFYDALYSQGDSLIKLDKATDAFEIFTLLETFCNRMPSGYCNDDYYHGILRSKVGVYESYLKIASVAKERHNLEMEQKFLLYAQEYYESNPELMYEIKLKQSEIIVEQKDTIIPKKVENVIVIEEQPQNEIKTTTQKNTPSEIKPKKETKSKTKPKKEPVVIQKETPIDSTAIKYKQYQELVQEGIDCCIREDFKQAITIFNRAEEMEQCNCFMIDGRVQIFLRELRKIKGENNR